MALSNLSGDEQGIILGQLCNTLEPHLAMNFTSACTELRALLTPLVRQQLRAATALCLKMGMRCKELREATKVSLEDTGLSATELATLSTLGSVLPALETLILSASSGSAGPDGVPRLAMGLAAGALPALTHLDIGGMNMGEAGATALAAALDRGALPRLKELALDNNAIGDSALVALAPALRRRPALDTLYLMDNPFGDEGLAALVAPPPPAGTLPLPPAGLKKLQELYLSNTQITDAGCFALAAALDSGVLPALSDLGHTILDLSSYTLGPQLIHSSDAARDAVHVAMGKQQKKQQIEQQEQQQATWKRRREAEDASGVMDETMGGDDENSGDDGGDSSPRSVLIEINDKQQR